MFLNDLRHGLRLLARSPGFTAVAVAVLALGIGATTAIFSVVDTVLLRPLPYRDSDRLVVVQEGLPEFGLDARGVPLPAPDVGDFRQQNQVFFSLAGPTATCHSTSRKAVNRHGCE